MKGCEEVAISAVFSPYAEVIINLIDDVSSVPEITATLKRDYLERIKKISQEEVHKAVGNYLGRVIDSLYGEDEEQRRVDVAKLVLGGRPEIVELTSQERRTVTSLLIDTCRQVYGDAPLSRL